MTAQDTTAPDPADNPFAFELDPESHAEVLQVMLTAATAEAARWRTIAMTERRVNLTLAAALREAKGDDAPAG